MAGRSIEDILRQQEAQRQAEIQRQQAQERAIYEQRERQRQDYLERMRMYEAQSAFAAASSAAGAGGHISEPVAVVDNSSSGTIIFNGIQNVNTGSWIKAPKETVSTWLPGTGDFTIEWFQYQTALGHPRIFSLGEDTGATIGVSIESNKVYLWPGGNNWAIGTTYSSTWIHVALVRTGGTSSCYINGNPVGTKQAFTDDITTSIKDLYIGSDHATSGDWFEGKITNFRWTNSTVYTGTFSVPTSPLTSLAQTKLLMLGGNVTNPVVDSTGINTLVNFNTTWSSDTPFV